MPTKLQSAISSRRKRKLMNDDGQERTQNEMPLAPVKLQPDDVAIEPSQTYYESLSRQQLEESADFLNKIKALQQILEFDILACDAKWTLFVSAAFSYRYDILLRPFPPQFATEQLGYDVDSLIFVIMDVPKLTIVLQILLTEGYNELSAEVIELLHWVLVEKSEPVLCLVEGEEFNAILSSIDDKPLKSKPTHVFKVNASEGFHCDRNFKDRTQNFPLKLAFMSNKLDTYYSILQNGLPPSKELDSYLQLSTDLPSSLQQSPYCAAWGKSQCGSIISCTAICEFAFNADVDKITANENDEACVNICLSAAENLRLRYLIFYGRRLHRSLLPRGGLFSWIYNYRFSLSLLSYLLILVTIGVANTAKGDVFKQYVAKQFDFAVAFYKAFLSKVPSIQ